MAPRRAADFSPDLLLQILSDLPRPSVYWVAYSGGLDSSVLLHTLAELRERLSAPLRALHIDHGLQADSAVWAAHCRHVCARLRISLTERKLQLAPKRGESLEAIAREARLQAFQSCMGRGELMLTAQHADDQAETLMLQLLRGSGLNGLAAMPLLSKLPPGHMARPLLEFPRAQLKAHALRRGLDWVDDPSNRDAGFDRNYLRLHVMPMLGQRWPAQALTLSRSARHCAEAADMIAETARERLQELRGSRDACLSVQALRALDATWCRAVLRQWIRERGFQRPDRVRLERIRSEVLTAAADRSPLVAWPGAQLRRYRDDLFLLSPLPDRPGVEIPWPGSAARLDLPYDLGYLERREQMPGSDLRVCFRFPGMYCRRGPNASRKTLKKLYQEMGVPDWLRPYVPLLFAGDELVAVADLCRCGSSALLPARWRGHAFTDCLPQYRHP